MQIWKFIPVILASITFSETVSAQQPDSLLYVTDSSVLIADTASVYPWGADSIALLTDSSGVGMDTSYFVENDDDYNLILAADVGDLDAVNMLIARGADLDARTWDGASALMYACQNGFPDIVDTLIRKGADVNAVPDNGMTALISVSKTGDYEIASLLVNAGAKIEITDENGFSALMYASAYNYPDLVELYLEQGTDINQRDWLGNNPLIMATYFGSYEAARVLLKNGISPDTYDQSGFTSLHIACQEGDYDIAFLLLDKGASVNKLNKGGLSPLIMAVQNRHTDIVELLLEHNANINQNISMARNSLDIAKKQKNEEMVELLFLHGIKPNPYPEISSVFMGLEFDFNGKDFLTGLSAGIFDTKYGLDISTGWLFRPAAIRILDKEHDLFAIQYWEKRSLIFLETGKNITAFSMESGEFGFNPALRAIYSWSRYRGSDAHPDPVSRIVPKAGFYWKNDFLEVSFSYEYLDYKIYRISPHRFNLGMEFFINLSKNQYYRKDIPSF